mgnify:CR=1 FL=1|jgi:hypothetical protein|tara:strand:- start:27 stop:332 length:306 start_codon:yes stop_codon:yes gene_type:complete
MLKAGLYLLENTQMEINVGDFIQLIVALVAIGVAYGVTKANIESVNKRVDLLETMVNKQIDVDDSIKEGQKRMEVHFAALGASLTEQMKALIERMDRNDNS